MHVRSVGGHAAAVANDYAVAIVTKGDYDIATAAARDITDTAAGDDDDAKYSDEDAADENVVVAPTAVADGAGDVTDDDTNASKDDD